MDITTITALADGYTAYASVAEIGVDAAEMAPMSPITITLSSWKCAAATGAITATIVGGC